MRDEIIRMAVEAGFSEAWLTAGANPPHFDAPAVIVERFYNLAVRHEREACAKLCESAVHNATDWDSGYWDQACRNRALAIRARGEKVDGKN